MFDIDKCRTLLTAICDKFTKREKFLVDLSDKLNALEYTSESDEKINKSLNKELNKIESYINKQDTKIIDRQNKLLNSNYLEDLEKDIMNTAKILSQSEDNFCKSIQDIVDEVMIEDNVDYLNFAKKYLKILINSAQQNLAVYNKQLEFINELFKGVNNEN